MQHAPHGPRIGIIGCGTIARTYLTNLASLGIAHAWAYADVLPAVAEACLDTFGGAYATADIERVFADPQVDVVIVASPDNFHADHALRALAAGKHLFLEKPLATSVADAERVQRAATASDRLCMVDLKYRFAHAVEAARRFVPHPVALVGQAVGDPEPPVTGGSTRAIRRVWCTISGRTCSTCCTGSPERRSQCGYTPRAVRSSDRAHRSWIHSSPRCSSPTVFVLPRLSAISARAASPPSGSSNRSAATAVPRCTTTPSPSRCATRTARLSPPISPPTVRQREA